MVKCGALIPVREQTGIDNISDKSNDKINAKLRTFQDISMNYLCIVYITDTIVSHSTNYVYVTLFFHIDNTSNANCKLYNTR